MTALRYPRITATCLTTRGDRAIGLLTCSCGTELALDSYANSCGYCGRRYDQDGLRINDSYNGATLDFEFAELEPLELVLTWR